MERKLCSVISVPDGRRRVLSSRCLQVRCVLSASSDACFIPLFLFAAPTHTEVCLTVNPEFVNFISLFESSLLKPSRGFLYESEPRLHAPLPAARRFPRLICDHPVFLSALWGDFKRLSVKSQHEASSSERCLFISSSEARKSRE